MTYEYDCPACGRFEAEQRMTDPALERCPTCKQPVVRVVSGGLGTIFKGDGWTPYLGKRRLTKQERET